MKIGVIIRCQRGKGFNIISLFKNKRIKEKIVKTADFELVLMQAEICGRSLDKKLLKAEKRLKKYGADVVLKGDDLKSEAEEKVLLESEARLFIRLALKLYTEYIRLLDLKAYKQKLLIIDRGCKAVSKSIMETVCFYSAKCRIITDNLKKAERIAEHIFKENGFYTEVSESGEKKDFDAVIDVDKKTLKISGKAFTDKIDTGIPEFTELNIGPLEVLKAFEEQGFKISYLKTVGSTAYFNIKNKNRA